MDHSRSLWAQASVRLRVVTGIVALVGFALLFYVEQTYGNLGGNTQGNLLAGIMLALITSGFFAIGIASLLVGLSSMRQERIAWHNHPNFLQGTGFVLLSFGFLILIGFFNHLLSRPLALELSLLCGALGLTCMMWAIGVSQVHRRS